MQTFTYTVNDPLGIHARPAGMLSKEAKKYASDVKIGKNGTMTNAKGVIGIMGLAVKTGEEFVITTEGADEAEAMEAMKKLITENL